jgi:hypothetical protein
MRNSRLRHEEILVQVGIRSVRSKCSSLRSSSRAVCTWKAALLTSTSSRPCWRTVVATARRQKVRLRTSPAITMARRPSPQLLPE